MVPSLGRFSIYDLEGTVRLHWLLTPYNGGRFGVYGTSFHAR